MRTMLQPGKNLKYRDDKNNFVGKMGFLFRFDKLCYRITKWLQAEFVNLTFATGEKVYSKIRSPGCFFICYKLVVMEVMQNRPLTTKNEPQLAIL